MRQTRSCRTSSASLLAAFLIGCQSGPAPSAPAPGASAVRAVSVIAAPAAPLCSGAAALEAKTRAVAAHCVATTVGILSSHAGGFASGSGVLVSADGLVLTAGHVVGEPGAKLTIRLTDGRVVNAVALGVDRNVDSGMARITDPAPAGGWPFSEVAPAASAAPGEWVLATGNPGGVVVGRNPPLRLGRVTIHDGNRIQSDCTVVSGDSGGPLFDLSGRVIGIHSNISLSVDENRHVPIGVYHAEWKDLEAGKAIHSKGGMLASKNKAGEGDEGGEGAPDGPDPARVAEALEKLAKEGDAEAKKLLADAAANGGQLPLDSQKAAELVARAKLPSGTPGKMPGKTPDKTPAKSAAPGGTDLARISEALAKLAKEGDAEAKKLLEDAKANGGKLGLMPYKMSELIERAKLPPKRAGGIPQAMRPAIRGQVRANLQKKFPGAKLTDELVDRILDKSSFDAATGHIALAPDMEDLKAMGLSPEAMAAHVGVSAQTTRVSQRLGETSLQALSLFAPALDAAGDCMVEVCDGGNPVLMGTVVGADGWIVTKASDLGAHPSVILADGRTLEAKVVGKDEATDLALLKVEAKNLDAAPFATDRSPLGAWLVSPVRDPNRPAVGLVSLAARPIPKTFAHFQGAQKILLGLAPKDPAKMVVGEVVEGLPAAAAGVKAGDEILSLDGKPAKDWLAFVAQVKAGKPGQALILKVRRDGQEKEFKMVLGDGKTATATHDGIGETDAVAGGKLSRRRTDFPMAIQHDAVVWADQCGGPLVDLRGKVVGVNIARYDRVCTFALPADVVCATVARLQAAPEAKEAKAQPAARPAAPR